MASTIQLIQHPYLPAEVWEIVLTHLDKLSLATAERVCKTWKSLTDQCWKMACLGNWPDALKDKGLTWKEHYKLQSTIDSNIQMGQARVTDLLDSSTDSLIPTTFCTEGNKLFVSGLVNSRRLVRPKTSILVLDISTGTRLFSLRGHQAGVLSLCIAAKQLFSGSMDQTIKVWNFETGKLLNTLQGHTGKVTTLCANNTTLFSGSTDKTICAWDLYSHAPIATFKEKSEAKSLCATETHLISLSDDLQIHIRSMHEKSPSHTLQGRAISAQKNTLFYSTEDSDGKPLIRSFNLENGTHLQDFQGGHPDPIHFISVTTGKLFSATGGFGFMANPGLFPDFSIRAHDLCTHDKIGIVPSYTKTGKVPVIGLSSEPGKLFLAYPLGKIRVLDYTHQTENQDLYSLPFSKQDSSS